MKLLILGGTKFLGRHLVQSALKSGVQVTLFNRGQTNPELFDHVEHIKGDRDGGMQALASRKWDVVVDTCGYVPRIVEHGLSQLIDKTEHYIFISTISVYAAASQPNILESRPVKVLDDPSIEQVTPQSYGGLKALCEQAVTRAFGDKAMIVRPGLIVGPHDPTDRFTYWPATITAGGDVLAPGDPQRPVQLIDVRDLADWLVATLVKPVAGVFNATGPQTLLTMEQLLTCCQSTLNSQSQLHWASEAFLLANKVEPWSDLPLWLPDCQPDTAGFMQCNSQQAIEQGLLFRPLAQTIDDTLQWHLTRSPDHQLQAGLSHSRQQALLEQWKNTNKA